MTAKGCKRLADIYAWDIKIMDVLAHLAGFHIRAVCQVDFSPDGNQFLTIGLDDDNSLAIYSFVRTMEPNVYKAYLSAWFCKYLHWEEAGSVYSEQA